MFIIFHIILINLFFYRCLALDGYKLFSNSGMHTAIDVTIKNCLLVKTDVIDVASDKLDNFSIVSPAWICSIDNGATPGS